MKALTIWQPWASLIMIGAKPYEFRRWDYREREAALEDQRIVIHAGSRLMKLEEIEDIIERQIGGVLAESASPVLRRAQESLQWAVDAMPEYRSAMALYRRQLKRPRMVGDPDPVQPDKPTGQILPLGFGLGTAKLLKPRRCTDLFGGQPDSDRIDQHMWAWPLVDIRLFDSAIEMRGAQGFWNWQTTLPAEAARAV